MSDMDRNQKNINSSDRKDKAINVTKPREVRSNFDTSRVSDLTLREQQALERLSKKIGASKARASASNIKSIIAIILVIILIVIAVLFIVLINQRPETEEMSYDVRMSMQIENKSILSIVTDTGKEELRKISPGDTLPIKAYVRNSDNYEGDTDTLDSNINPQNVYVRFKIKVILGYDVRYDIIRPTINTNWYVFNAEDEASLPDGKKEGDNYYYYKGSLPYTKRAELFSELHFYGPAISCEDGGKYGQIQVIVESTPAITESITNNIWPTAPRRWIVDTVTGIYNKENS